MKKTILTIIAILSLWVASANERSINTSLWPVLMVDYTTQWLRIQKVGCNSVTNMCYTESEMKRVFNKDIKVVEKNYTDLTGKQPVREYLATLLR